MGQLNDSQLKAWLREHRATQQPLAGKADGDGLTFKISKAGAREGFGQWGLRYRHGAQQCWLPIGRYPTISLKEARDRAQRERVRVSDGVDVATERRRAKIALRTAQTFGELAEEYVARVAGIRAESTRYNLRMYLDNDVLPYLRNLKLDGVAAADVVAIVERTAKRTHAGARECYRYMNAIFQHGVAKLACKTNPCVGLKLTAIIGAPRPSRPRVNLTQDDLRAVLTGLPRLGLRNALAVKIILATAVRKGELVRARWEYLDLEAGVWTVPGELSKTGKGFQIPLAPPVVGWFTDLKALAAGNPWVLPGRNPRLHMDLTTLNVALDRLPSDVCRFTPHDLRSTARSHLAALGVDMIVAERCLNHALGGLVAVYNKHDYMTERRHALELWADCLRQCEEPLPENVTTLRAA